MEIPYGNYFLSPGDIISWGSESRAQVQLQLVGGTMKKRWPREKVQHALHAAGIPQY